MKHLTCIAAALAGAAAFGGPVSVDADSSETLGMYKPVKAAGGATVLGVPFVKSPTLATNTVDTLLVAGYGNLDMIRIWNATGTVGSEYDTWRWDKKSKSWAAVRKSTGAYPAPAAEHEVPRGYAFWFTDMSGETNGLVQAGLVKADSETRVNPGTAAQPVYTLLNHPFGMAADLKEMTSGGKPVDGDQIVGVAMAGDTETPVPYVYKSGKGWCVVTPGKVIRTLPNGTKIMSPATYAAVDAIPMREGQAFWYVSKGATDVTLGW